MFVGVTVGVNVLVGVTVGVGVSVGVGVGDAIDGATLILTKFPGPYQLYVPGINPILVIVVPVNVIDPDTSLVGLLVEMYNF